MTAMMLFRRNKKTGSEVSEIEEELRNTLLNIPNAPLQVAVEPASSNVESEMGEQRALILNSKLTVMWTGSGILDFERAAKISGTNFYRLKDLRQTGARVINFILIAYEEHGLTENLPPLRSPGRMTQRSASQI
jgi:seryl-tRNA synthetase